MSNFDKSPSLESDGAIQSLAIAAQHKDIEHQLGLFQAAVINYCQMIEDRLDANGIGKGATAVDILGRISGIIEILRPLLVREAQRSGTVEQQRLTHFIDEIEYQLQRVKKHFVSPV